MKRLDEVEDKLFEHLSELAKIVLTLNDWFVSNRQSYLTIIAFFINRHWKLQKIVIEFEFMNMRHTDETMTKVVKKMLEKHNIQNRILVCIIDNAFNNSSFFLKLLTNLIIVSECVNVISSDEVSNEQDQNKIVHVSCLTHVLQLALKIFLRSVRVKSTNDELQKNWNDQEDVNIVNQADKDLSLTLAKISNAASYLINVLIFVLIFSK
jgi:hypothetical protein